MSNILYQIMDKLLAPPANQPNLTITHKILGTAGKATAAYGISRTLFEDAGTHGFNLPEIGGYHLEFQAKFIPAPTSSPVLPYLQGVALMDYGMRINSHPIENLPDYALSLSQSKEGNHLYMKTPTFELKDVNNAVFFSFDMRVKTLAGSAQPASLFMTGWQLQYVTLQIKKDYDLPPLV